MNKRLDFMLVTLTVQYVNLFMSSVILVMVPMRNLHYPPLRFSFENCSTRGNFVVYVVYSL